MWGVLVVDWIKRKAGLARGCLKHDPWDVAVADWLIGPGCFIHVSLAPA